MSEWQPKFKEGDRVTHFFEAIDFTGKKYLREFEGVITNVRFEHTVIYDFEFEANGEKRQFGLEEYVLKPSKMHLLDQMVEIGKKYRDEHGTKV